MDYYNKYLKYKKKYLELANENTFEFNEHPLAHLKKYNFYQQGGDLPKMYTTDIPAKIEAFLKSDNKVAIVYAPTGYGKTVTGCRVIAKVVNNLKKEGKTIKGEVLMPFRISVKEMFNYLIKLGEEQKEELTYGYAMGGGDKSEKNETKDIVVQTIGYWLVRFLENMDDMTEKIIMLDEVHDSSWQTNFVLNLLLWKIREGANIKLIISSATLDVAGLTEKYNIKPAPEVFSVEPKLANVEITYHDRNTFNPLDDENKLQDIMIKYIVSAAKNPIVTRHILALMPGEQDIKDLIIRLKKNDVLIAQGFKILPLYSSLEDDQIKSAIVNVKEERKIIVATNMVENAITIDDLSATVDSCVRKEEFIDNNNIREIKRTLASQANIIQTAGRSGRQGVKGIAYVAISAKKFELFDKYTLNQIEKQPLYRQLIIIFKKKLPYLEILKSSKIEKINENIRYLIDNMIVEIDGDNYKLTRIGEIIYNLNTLGINAAIFVANCILFPKDDSSYFYYVFLIAVWIDTGRGVLETTNGEVTSNYKQFMKNDSLETFLYVWTNWLENKKNLDLCKSNGLSINILKEIEEKMNRINYKNKKYEKIEYADVKEMFKEQFINSFSKFKLILKGNKQHGQYTYQNYSKQTFNLNLSNVFVNDRQNSYILGLSFFKVNDSVKITNFIVRDKIQDDLEFEEVESKAKLIEFKLSTV